jgi:hypothetical protein
MRLAKVSAHCLPFGLDEIHGATVSGDQMWVTGRTRSIRFPRGWEEMPGLTAGFDRPFVARLAPMRRAIEAAWLLTPHVGRGNAIAIRAEGMVFASGETTDAGNRSRVRDGSNIAPTAGAFSVGAQWGAVSTNILHLPARVVVTAADHLTSADAPPRPRGVERRERMADDHPP